MKYAPEYVNTFIDEEKIREQLFYPFIKSDTIFLDVGAAFGSYTLNALERGCSKVIAIDPVIDGLKKNIELNNFEKRCKIVKKYAGTKFKIDSIKSRIDFIKIDVEGMELQVLESAQKTIKKNHPYILVECHEFIHKGIKEKVVNLIRSFTDKYTNITQLPYIDMKNIRQIDLNQVQIWHLLFIPG